MKYLRWSFLKIADCIQPLIIFAKHFILGVSQGHKYASDMAKQNPGALPLIPQKKTRLQSLKIPSTFKLSIIFTLYYSERLLIIDSIHVSLISN